MPIRSGRTAGSLFSLALLLPCACAFLLPASRVLPRPSSSSTCSSRRSISSSPARRAASAVSMNMEQLTVQPIKTFEGEVELPGSKSISNRILLLAALSQGTTVVDNLLQSEVRTPCIDSVCMWRACICMLTPTYGHIPT